MKKLLLFVLLVIVPAIIINSCDDGSGGGGGGIPDSPAGTFTKQVVLAGTDSPYSNMLGSTFTDSRFMLLYPVSEIKASGNITSISLRYNADQTASRCRSMTIKMGHTDVASLDEDIATAVATYASNIELGKGSFVTVLENADVTIPAGNAGDYFTINLSTPFNYNGIDNLVVQISRTAACDTTVPIRTHPIAAADTYYTIYGVSNSPDPSAVEAVTGTRYAALPDMQFVFRGGENISVTGTNTTVCYPFTTSSFSNNWNSQQLYLANEIIGSGQITGIAFPLAANNTELKTFTINVKLGHRDKSTSELTNTFAANINVGSPVTVANGVTISIPAGLPAGSYVWIPMPDGTFIYNGTDNLVVEIQVTAGDGNLNILSMSASNRRLLAGLTDEVGTLNASGFVFGIKFRFHGASISIIGDDASNSSYVFDTSLHGLMGLYRATELGSSGTIRTISCRLDKLNSVEADYGHFRIFMGHSAANSLSTTAADNFTERYTVFDGTFQVPDGLIRGDWITIPLSTPFVYDGKSNLVIWMGTYAASGAGVKHSCSMSAVSGLYTGNLASGVPGNVTVAAPTNQKLDMQFKISK